MSFYPASECDRLQEIAMQKALRELRQRKPRRATFSEAMRKADAKRTVRARVARFFGL